MYGTRVMVKSSLCVELKKTDSHVLLGVKILIGKCSNALSFAAVCNSHRVITNHKSTVWTNVFISYVKSSLFFSTQSDEVQKVKCVSELSI